MRARARGGSGYLAIGLVLAAFGAGVAQGAGSVIFRDSFSNPKSGWWVGHDRTGSAVYLNGAYWMRVNRDDYVVNGNDLKKIVHAANMAIDATQRRGAAGDEVGIICYANAARDVGYYFVIGPPDAYYAIRRVNTNKHVKELIRGHDPVAIHGLLKTNHLLAECTAASNGRPATLAFYVNGKFVAQASDNRGFKRLAGIGVDLASQKGGSIAVFDNALVTER